MAILINNHIVHKILRLLSYDLLVTKKLSGKVYLPALFLVLSTEASVLKSLKTKYPECTIKNSSYFLSKDEKKFLIEKFPTKEIASYYNYYKKSCEKSSHVFVLSDLVRTHKQFLLFEFEKENLSQIELLRFLEPKEYMVNKKWYKNFYHKSPEDINKVDSISGATLTVSSTKFLSFLSMYLIDKVEKYEKRNKNTN